MHEGTMKTRDAARRLWDWFSENSGEVAARYGAEDYAWLDHELSPRVSAIAEEMNWGIGPYSLPNETFVLSPTVRENLPKAHAAVALAFPKSMTTCWRRLDARGLDNIVMLRKNRGSSHSLVRW